MKYCAYNAERPCDEDCSAYESKAETIGRPEIGYTEVGTRKTCGRGGFTIKIDLNQEYGGKP